MGEICRVDGSSIGIFADARTVWAGDEGVGVDENADVGHGTNRCGRATRTEKIKKGSGCELLGFDTGVCPSDLISRGGQCSMKPLVVAGVEVSEDFPGAGGGVRPVAQGRSRVMTWVIDVVLVSDPGDELVEVAAELAHRLGAGGSNDVGGVGVEGTVDTGIQIVNGPTDRVDVLDGDAPLGE